jgi:hypothetical protein
VSARGAALHGRLAPRVFADPPQAQAAPQPALRVIEPLEAWQDRDEAHYPQLYQPAHGALRAVHHAADAIERAAQASGPNLPS